MNKAVSIVFLIGGLVLLGFGINAYNAPVSEISRFFTGSPTDKAMWLLIGGSVATLVGLIGLIKTR